jgi:iron complex transport system substrate-binding protein
MRRAVSKAPAAMATRRALLGALSTLPVTGALGCRRGAALGDGTRLVTLGSAVTEIVFALGAGGHIVGVDGSSQYPAEATKLAKVGYYRTFSVEGVLGLGPTLVMLTDEAGPPAAVEQLRQSGIRLLRVRSARTVAEARERIAAIGRELSLEARAQQLVGALDRDLARAAEVARHAASQPRALFIYAGRGAMSVAGKATTADEMLRLAGARNAVTSFEGFHQVSHEAVVQAAPDVLVVTTRGHAGLGGLEGVLALPGVALTPAGRSRRVVVMDDLLLLGFGPRLGQAADQLARALREGAKP